MALVAWLALGELWADVDRVRPDLHCHERVDAAGRTKPVGVGTVEDAAQEDGVPAADARSVAAEALDAASGVAAVAGSRADVGQSGLGCPLGTSSQLEGARVRGDGMAAAGGA